MGVALCLCVVGVGSNALAVEEGASTALTIYSTAQPGAIPPELYRPIAGLGGGDPHWAGRIPGYAIVKQERPFTLERGRSTIRFTDVAAQIDPTTVSFVSLTDPEGTHVLEQNYEFDLVSTEKLMRRFLDKQITVEQVQGDKLATFTGKLLSTAGGLVLQDSAGGVQVISGYS
ncbi:MAG: DUF4139 domain-containing protein, partial [Phycisphaerae bacterium]